MRKADIGLIGLGVMGENLVLNMAGKGFCVAVFNRTVEKVKNFCSGRGNLEAILPAYSLDELVSQLSVPRKVMIMVKAGQPVDDLIEELIKRLEPGDIIIDGGNAQFTDTMRRCSYVESKGFSYIGTGVSGGEEGALKGPSIMPGGTAAAWKEIQPVFQAICAKTPDGTPCCSWIGDSGAGHFVKMVHNGIEYGDMQIICEAYQLMRDLLQMSADEMAEVFDQWNQGPLGSYLIEITANILKYKDEDGSPLVEKILDKAGQKGTGKWTVMHALDEGIPLTVIAEAVFARCLSARKEDRVLTARTIGKPQSVFQGDKEKFLKDLEQAVYAAKLISYAQGFQLIKEASSVYQWKLDYSAIAMVWRGGCIIRSVFLERIADAYTKAPELKNLVLDPYFSQALQNAQDGWRNICAEAFLQGIPIPVLSAALTYFDGIRTEYLPANLLQAQRDYFGAHTYQRVDAESGQVFHTNWTGEGGETCSSVYQV